MDELYEKLFFLMLGGLLAYLVNKLTENSKARSAERIRIKSAYAKWYAASRVLVERIDQISADGIRNKSNPEGWDITRSELRALQDIIEKVWDAMYEAYFFEPLESAREAIRLSTEKLLLIRTKLELKRETLELQAELIKKASQLVETIKKAKESGKFGEDMIDARLADAEQKYAQLCNAEEVEIDLRPELERYQQGLDDLLVLIRQSELSRARTWLVNRQSRKKLAANRKLISDTRLKNVEMLKTDKAKENSMKDNSEEIHT